ncbi:hypothetical protein WU86_08550 [Corynebacterium xerosis]|nr:hypothetical protein WU86_08550 [Corynebacterium xerosis]
MATAGSARIRYSLYSVENTGTVGVENSHTVNRPPGRVTRAISRSPARKSWMLRRPKLMVTASKVPSGNGRSMPSPQTFGTSRWAPAASMPREKSQAMTVAPDFDSSTVDTAVPAARSRTSSPGARSRRRPVSRRQCASMPALSTVLVMS